MSALETTNYDLKEICLGNNVFESGTINLAAAGSCKVGQFVKRDSSGKLVVITDISTEAPVGVMMEDLTNSGSSSADFGCRILIAGLVNRSMLLVNTTAATVAQCDILRDKTAIVPVAVKELCKQDNQ